MASLVIFLLIIYVHIMTTESVIVSHVPFFKFKSLSGTEDWVQESGGTCGHANAFKRALGPRVLAFLLLLGNGNLADLTAHGG